MKIGAEEGILQGNEIQVINKWAF